MDSEREEINENAYKNKPMIDGVYSIDCTRNNRKWIKATCNLCGQKNRFVFAVSMDGCPEPAMHKEWSEYGTKYFYLHITWSRN